MTWEENLILLFTTAQGKQEKDSPCANCLPH